MTMPYHIPRSQRSTEYVEPPAGWLNVTLANLTPSRLKARGASDFSHGPGLVTPELRDAPPDAGGRYRGTPPPSAWPYPSQPRTVHHVWGNTTEGPPKQYPRSPYDD